ncbi:raffinose/stachyose/melibiose transport system permease protein [Paenibacillus sp. yr247]|uniref:carbohydrate ABC transporter permease n=1 Tax=Paenibacillus sp. yr247 TaxID=1761880 RepID=UPI00087F7004|nr:sugar ABC transporter permease [Paenibacillus sp. yr247]SDO32989.1 raffinose/stachyose/melibiose transport system permease protein [Paenibacillus sp. yr247]
MDSLHGPPQTVEAVIKYNQINKRIRLTSNIRKWITIISFLSPAVLLYGVFMLYPMFEAVRLSFFDWNGSAPIMNFVGLNNYIDILNDKVFILSLKHNIVWLVLDLVLLVIPVLLLAVMISKVKRGRLFFRTGFYLPAVLSLPVVSVLWGKIYDPMIGPINVILKSIGLNGLAINWLGHPWAVLPAIIIAGAWAFYGIYMIIYLSGLQSIDYSMYEAADMDGAGPIRKFWYITVPSLKNTINIVTTMVIVYGFKSFALIWIMTQGGPFYKSELVATYVYKAGFAMFKVSFAAAGSVILAVIVVVLTILFNAMRERSN